MKNYEKKLNEFYKSFGTHKTMVLSTSLNDKVSSRMMSIIFTNGKFYFQTDKTSRKFSQIKENKYAALCAENIQIEGICTEYGKPEESQEFCRLYEKYHHDSYIMYSGLENEVLFEFTPVLIQR